MLSELCKSCSMTDIATVLSAGQARDLLINKSYDIIIINSPLSDESGKELALFVAENYCSGVLLLVKKDDADKVSALVQDAGVFVLHKPVNRYLFSQSIRLMHAYSKRIRGLHNKTIKLETKIEETQLINRAKCVLIQYLKMTESQAHRYIEKQAMDLRQPKRSIAESIIKTYEY